MRIFLLLSLLWLATPALAEPMNVIGCGIFDSSGKEQKAYLGWICAFLPNGKMMIGDGFTLTFYDKDMNVIWARDGHTHHMLTYSAADQTVLVISSRIFGPQSRLRIDVLEVFDIEGKQLKKFEFTREMSRAFLPMTYDNFVMPTVKMELTHVGSFYRIGKNRSGSRFFAEGNYLVNDNFGALYVFNKELTKVIHTFETNGWNLGMFGDVQVTPAGSLLLYNNGNPHDPASRASLVEFDPFTKKVLWRYRGETPDFLRGAYEGNVQILPSGNILFSEAVFQETVEPHELWQRSTEITRAGKKVWQMKKDRYEIYGIPNVVKRLDLSAYRKTKGAY